MRHLSPYTIIDMWWLGLGNTGGVHDGLSTRSQNRKCSNTSGVICVCLHNEGSAGWETERRMILLRAYHGHRFAGLESVWALLFFCWWNWFWTKSKVLLLMINYISSRGVAGLGILPEVCGSCCGPGQVLREIPSFAAMHILRSLLLRYSLSICFVFSSCC